MGANGQVGVNGQGPAFGSQPCPECKKMMAVRIPVASIFNSPTVSMLVFTHERIDRCDECGSSFVPLVAGLTPEGTIGFQWKKVDQPSAIVAGTQKNMSQALDM